MCPYGKFLGDRWFCPFVEGSCIKIPSTIFEPNKSAVEYFMQEQGYLRVTDEEGKRW